MDILVVDNYDSFVYNIVRQVLNAKEKYDKQHWNIKVVRNDKIELREVSEYDKIILSPGPGLPSEAGIMPELVDRYNKKSILGICLGHQAIAEVFGATLKNIPRVVHGETRNTILKSRNYLFEGVPDMFPSGRYHSWVVDPASNLGTLQVMATDDEGEIMAICHKNLDVQGLQFHPESILTSGGDRIIENWLLH